ncbi:MAG: redoxin domain-containing protein [Phycisphaerales bacterium]
MRTAKTVAVLTLVPVLGAILGWGAVAAGQGREPLKVGDPAPALAVDAWVAGSELSIEKGNTYVVMFWDSVTSSGHTDGETVKSMSRLRKLYELYDHKGLIVIVISPDDADRLGDLVKSQPQEIGFTIAADRRSSTHRAWVRKAEIKELPVAFIVGDGRIMHIGQPRDADFLNILVQVMSGRYDPKIQAEAQPKLDRARRSRKQKNWRMANKWYDEVIAMNARVFSVIALEQFEMLLADMDEYDLAYDYARDQLIDRLFAADAVALQMLAVKISEDPVLGADQRDLDVAALAAERSLELAGRRNADALACAAGVHFHRGEYQEAIRLQTQAYFNARPLEKAAHKGLLNGYRKGSKAASSLVDPG